LIKEKINKPVKVTKTKTFENWDFGNDDYYEEDDDYYDEDAVEYRDIKKKL